jgi:hypothetical protein
MCPENLQNEFTDRPITQKLNFGRLSGFQEQNMFTTDEMTSRHTLESERTNKRYTTRASASKAFPELATRGSEQNVLLYKIGSSNAN